MAKKTVKGTKPYTGTAKADKITVIGKKNKVSGAGGNDTITVSKGSGHKIYGAAGNDKIYIKGSTKSSHIYGDDAKGKVTGKDTITISGGKKNTVYGGKGNDTIILNGGSSNTIYGGKGNDVFVIGKDSTGIAVVKDFSTKKGNTDKVKIADGVVKNIKVSGKNMVVTGGGSGSLTLQNAKSKTFAVTDSDWSYTVSSGKVKLVLNKDFKGEFTAPSFLTTIDARKVAGGNVSNVRGNAKANTIYVAKVEGGAYHGEDGNDTIFVTDGDRHNIYPGIGKDTVTINAGNGHVVRCGGGDDEITIGANAGDGIEVWGTYGTDKYDESRETVTIKGGNTHNVMLQDGDDTFVVTSGSGHTLDGGGGNDRITVSGGGNVHSIFGRDGDDVISVTGGVNHHIEGGAGKDTITVTNVTFDSNSSYRNTNTPYISAGYAGTKTVTLSGCKNAIVYGSEDGNTINILNSQNTEVSCAHGNDKVNITGGNNTKVYTKKGTNTISVSGKNVTIEQWGWGNYYEDKGAKDSVTVNWSANIGRLTIKTSYPENSNSVDALTINNVAVSNLKFYKVNTWDLLIESTNSNNGNSIFIDGWFSRKAFSNGVNIGGTPYKYSWISDRAMLKS